MKHLLGWLLGCLGGAAILVAEVAAPVSSPARPIPAVEHVVIISVDGLRPDCALRADMPTMRAMLRSAAYTFWARTTAIAITLPSHTSMVTGVVPNKHNILWNSDLPFATQVYPRVPTLMEMATKAGYSTAMIAGKRKFAALNKPGTVTYPHLPENDAGSKNDEVADEAAKIITAHRPALVFVHFPDSDAVGHDHGWGSPEQIAQIEKTDGQIARVLRALDEARIRESTVVILTADHGGAGKTHGADDPRSRHIPWIVTGPGVRAQFDLTRLADLEIRTEDTCATACWLLGLPQLPNFDGHPVYPAFELPPTMPKTH